MVFSFNLSCLIEIGLPIFVMVAAFRVNVDYHLVEMIYLRLVKQIFNIKVVVVCRPLPVIPMKP